MKFHPLSCFLLLWLGGLGVLGKPNPKFYLIETKGKFVMLSVLDSNKFSSQAFSLFLSKFSILFHSFWLLIFADKL
jgi:hypothetical protein